jgi:hypothetical protein
MGAQSGMKTSWDIISRRHAAGAGWIVLSGGGLACPAGVARHPVVVDDLPAAVEAEAGWRVPVRGVRWIYSTTRADIHSRCDICGSSVRPVHGISIDAGLVHIGPIASSTGSVGDALLLQRPQIQDGPGYVVCIVFGRLQRSDPFQVGKLKEIIAAKNKLESESIFNLNHNPA